MTKTAARRHQHERHAARRLANPYWGSWYNSPGLSDVDRAVIRNRAARHSVMCSCWMCGHARERDGMTVQERRAAQSVDWGTVIEGVLDDYADTWDKLADL